jgi:predicted dehydrogenase
MAGDAVRWGILGTGGIARSFAADLALLPDAETVAVGSRDPASAEAFSAYVESATGTPVAHRHASYAALVADPDVDVVYVGTPHPWHAEHALMAIAAGKAVLVEKPFAMSEHEAARVVSAARERGVFCMEGMWTRFLPHVVRLRELLASGRLGRVVTLTADHGQWFAEDAAHRLFAPHLGGGALLDLGIYPLSFASMVLGTPDRVAALGTPAFTGVDATTSVLLTYAGGAHAVVTTTLAATTANVAVISGTEARVHVAARYMAPSTLRLVDRGDQEIEVFDDPHEGVGLRHEAAEVGRCLPEGLLESPVMPLDESLSILRTLDEVRRQTGLRYPTDD